jgi:hypothetical protein
MFSSDKPSTVSTDNEIATLRREISDLRIQLERVNRERIEYLQNVSHQLA